VALALVAAAGASGPAARGQEGTPRPRKAPGQRAERLAEMAAIARAITVVTVDGRGNETPASRSEEPPHTWTDPTREFSDGGMWVWHAGGRPVATVGIERYAWWSLEFVSLSPGLVGGSFARANVRWRPQKAGVEFSEIAGAPGVAGDKAGRSRQMRALAARFSAREVWAGNKHFTLRLLPHPIDRYAAPDSGTVDGGLFIFANGTNPEALLLVEARRRGDGPAVWSFAAAPLSHSEITLKRDGAIVWTTPSKDAGPPILPSDPYFDVLVRPGLVSSLPPRPE
jgi:hypothetical protein